MLKKRVKLFGVYIDDVDMKAATALARASLRGGRARVFFTPNFEMLAAARRSGEIRELLNGSSVNLCDGTGVKLVAKLMGKTVENKVAGIDFGESRTGLALSDAARFLASGLGNIPGGGLEKTAERILEAAREHNAVALVLGLPVNMNGTSGEKVEKVTLLGELIRTHTDTPIDFFDERMTTVRAHQILQESGVRSKNRRKIIDSLAAELILQGYMDMKRNKH